MRTVGWLIDTFRPAVAVETGTYRGTTTAWFAEECGLSTYTVEKQWRFATYSRIRFLRDRRVHVTRGDSRRFLRRLGSRGVVPARSLFYLDAHWGTDFPLRTELEIIAAAWPRAIVIIDDFLVPWDDGYGYDDYGVSQTVGLDRLDGIRGLDCYLPTAPSSEETGARRGTAYLTPESDRDTMESCPDVRRWIPSP